MPTVQVLDMTGKVTGEITLSDAIFGIEPNKAVMHEAVKNYLANQRQGTQSTLTRTEVSGGGRKPWRQKGTGRARQGSIRAPQWAGGGVAFAPKPRDYGYRLNKKTRRLALKSALSAKLKVGELVVVKSIDIDEIKTKTVAAMLEALGACKKPLIVTPEVDKKVVLSTRNIEGAKTTVVGALNTYDILDSGKFILTEAAVQKIQEVYV